MSFAVRDVEGAVPYEIVPILHFAFCILHFFVAPFPLQVCAAILHFAFCILHFLSRRPLRLCTIK